MNSRIRKLWLITLFSSQVKHIAACSDLPNLEGKKLDLIIEVSCKVLFG